MSEIKYFKLSDFDCQETGENEMDIKFIHKLDELRGLCGFPFYVSSGYRSPNHSIEKAKQTGNKITQIIDASNNLINLTTNNNTLGIDNFNQITSSSDLKEQLFNEDNIPTKGNDKGLSEIMKNIQKAQSDISGDVIDISN